jgi:hypothetical protein
MYIWHLPDSHRINHHCKQKLINAWKNLAMISFNFNKGGKPIMPSVAIMDGLELLYSSIYSLLDARKTLDKLTHDLRVAKSNKTILEQDVVAGRPISLVNFVDNRKEDHLQILIHHVTRNDLEMFNEFYSTHSRGFFKQSSNSCSREFGNGS